VRFINLLQLGHINPVEVMDRKIIGTEPNGRQNPLLVPPALFRSGGPIVRNQKPLDTLCPRSVIENNVAFAPLRFTIVASESSNNDCIRPVLVSPPTHLDDKDIRGSGVCPFLPAMEDMTPRHVGEQTSGFVLSQGFVTQKKQEMTPTRQKHYLGFHLSPIALDIPEARQDSKNIEEAASVIFNMRYAPALSPSKQPLAEGKDSLLNNKIQLVPRLQKRASVEVPDAAVVPLNPTSIFSTELESITATADNQIQMKKKLRLGLPGDSLELNSLHCFVRSELLELFVADDGTKHSKHVGIRCVHCAEAEKRDSATMACFFPKSLRDIYRSVCTWQRVHFRECEHIPKETRETYSQFKANDRSRGRVQYWVTSALQLGLEDIGTKREGICFALSSRTNKLSKKRRFRS
jgi:hypothetical protein